MGLLGAVAAPPAIPVAAYGLAALGSLIAYMVCYGMLHGWNVTFGRFFVWLGNKGITIARWSVHPFGFLLKMNQEVRAGLGTAVAATEHAVSYTWNQTTSSALTLAHFVEGLTVDVYTGMVGLGHRMGQLEAAALGKAAHAVAALIHRIVSAAIAYERRRINRIFGHTNAKVASVARTAGHAIALPFPRIGRLEKTAKAQAKRITRLEKLLAGGLGVALLVRAMSKLGIGFLRCSNVKRAGKRICGMDADLLESLLGASLILAGSISLRDLARELEEPTKLVADGLHALIDEF